MPLTEKTKQLPEDWCVGRAQVQPGVEFLGVNLACDLVLHPLMSCPPPANIMETTQKM